LHQEEPAESNETISLEDEHTIYMHADKIDWMGVESRFIEFITTSNLYSNFF
jgi:hypothetical protein